ncbi:MAG: hypothetical protein JNM81_13760 [Rhodospirillaceae bacterium]|nr:hypothetical protein [Rhodospirillaceae bacterium]
MRDEDDDKPKKKKAAPVKRRSALKTVGLSVAGVVGLGVAGVGARAYQVGVFKNATDGPGFDPWRAWEEQVRETSPGADAKKPLTGKAQGLVAAAVLAASAHNSQPWRFAARGNLLDVIADERRNLGSIDPQYRELNISVGCAIENIVLGASGVGITPLLNIFPDGPLGNVFARFTIFDGVAATSKEAKALHKRSTNRGAYIRGKALDFKILDALSALNTSGFTKLIWLTADSDAGKRFAAGTVKATADFIADKNMVVDSHNWFRFSAGDHRDGLTLPTTGISPMEARIALMLPKGFTGDPHKAWLAMTRDVHVATAPHFGLITIPALNDRAALVEVGRLWQRLQVQTAVMGLAAQPLNQMMEMVDRDRTFQRASEAEITLNNLATLSGNVVAFAFRIGYSRALTALSPRRNVEDVLSKA